MDYRLVFDLAKSGYPWLYPAAGLLVAAAMALLAALAAPKGDVRRFCGAGSGLLLLWLIILVGRSYPAYATLLEAEQAGSLSVAEGTVSHFRPGAVTVKERFCVETKCFEYWPETLPVSFMNTRLQGGPVVKDGLHVRVAAAGDAIVRLEVAGGRHFAAR